MRPSRTVLAADPQAKAFFETLRGASRYAILYRVHDAKTPETRAAHIAQFVEMCHNHETIHWLLARFDAAQKREQGLCFDAGRAANGRTLGRSDSRLVRPRRGDMSQSDSRALNIHRSSLNCRAVGRFFDCPAGALWRYGGVRGG